MKLTEYRKTAIERLTCAGIERPAYVVDMLLAKITGISQAHLVAHPDFDIDSDKLCKIEMAIDKRLQRVPLSYILGEAEFYGYIFKVGQCCLIPRPETELIVEAMLDIAQKGAYFADWCTGSGCIAISMLLERKDLTAVAVDASEEALKWADKNRKLYGLEERLTLIQNANPAALCFDKKFDCIVSNPPYIAEDQMSGLMKDVIEYEPSVALNGGKDGVELYRLFFATLPVFVKHGGYIGFEIAGDKQAELLKIMAPQILKLVREIRDYNGILRHLIWQVV